MITGRPITAILYGKSGVGKTTLSATAPRPFFLDSNQGTLSLEHRGFVYGRQDVFSMRDLDRGYKRFSKSLQKKYDTCVFDHFDDIQSIVMEELGDAGAERDDRRDPDALEQRDWGILAMRLKRNIRKFKTLPVHKILILGETENEEGVLVPSLQGQLKNQLPYFADYVFYLRKNEKTGRRFLHLDPTGEFYAKTRSSWLPPEYRKIEVKFDDLKTLTTLFELIAAGPKGNNKPRRNK